MSENSITVNLKAMRILALFACMLFLLGCGESKKPAAESAAVPAQAPDSYQVKFETSKGDFVVDVTKAWAPQGADRFYTLVKRGFYDGDRFFRVVRGFVVQFGINGDPSVSRLWQAAFIPDDPVKQSNQRGYITFATSGPSSRTTQVFINLTDNTRLDGMGFAPFGKVTSGMDVVDRLYSSYGEGPPRGEGPDQSQIETRGNDYLESKFPRLHFVKKATVLPPG